METKGDRLRQARINAGHTSARQAALHFRWRPSTYAAHENGQNDFDSDQAEIYAKAFKTTPSQLMFGEPRVAKIPKNERLRVVSSYDPDAPERPLDPDAPPDPATFPADAIKELASKGGLGNGQIISTTFRRGDEEIVSQDQILDDFWRVPPHVVRNELNTTVANLLVVQCEGDSMVPTIGPKDRVIVDVSHKKLSPDGLYAIRNRYEDIVVKRLTLLANDRVEIVSDNSKHSLEVVGLDEIAIVGKVVLGLKLF